MTYYLIAVLMLAPICAVVITLALLFVQTLNAIVRFPQEF
jgi:hypothetical protein